MNDSFTHGGKVFSEAGQKEILKACQDIGELLDGKDMNKVVCVFANLLDSYFAQLREQQANKNEESDAARIEEAIHASASYLNYVLLRHLLGGDDGHFEQMMKDLNEKIAEITGEEPPTIQ